MDACHARRSTARPRSSVAADDPAARSRRRRRVVVLADAATRFAWPCSFKPAGCDRHGGSRVDTPLAEVQLAEPIGQRLVAVVRVYTDDADEFVALVLSRRGSFEEFSLDAADWAETAPLGRFRLVGRSLYQLGSTPADRIRRPLRPGGSLMWHRSRSFLVAFVAAFFLASAGTAAAYHTRFVADNCNTNLPRPTSYITRDGSSDGRAPSAVRGIPVGGRLLERQRPRRLSERPDEDPATGGEGGDCSGFTFKVWRESLTRATRASISGACCATCMGRTRPRVQVRSRRAERHGVQVCLDQDGRLGEREPHRHDLRDERRWNGSDHRGERRGVRDEHLDADVPRRLELRRCSTYWLELLERDAWRKRSAACRLLAVLLACPVGLLLGLRMRRRRLGARRL